MKLIIVHEKLKEGVKIIERIAQKNLTLPILQNVLLKTEKNFLCFSGTNLEVGIKYWALAKTESEGQLAIPARVLSQLVDFLPQKPVNIEKKENDLIIESLNYKSKIKGFGAEEFPIIPGIKEGESVVVPGSFFCQAVSQVIDIASPSIARPEISGVYLSFQKDTIKIVATDSFRLGEQKLPLKSSLTKEYSLILPQQTAKEIVNIFGQKEEDLKIYFSPNQILFESSMVETNHPQIQVTSRLIEGSYPDYETIIPVKTATQIQVQKNEFLNQIKSASLFGGKTNEIVLRADPKKNGVEVLSQSADLGEYHSRLPSRVEGKAIEVSFNHRFLAEGLSRIKSSEVLFELTDEEHAALLKGKEPERFLYIVMPIKKN